VSPGAELIADGNIHIYGTFRGKALAGARGNPRARIFIQSVEAELVSIAGVYRTFAGEAPYPTNVPSQVYLEGEKLVVAALHE
jgi:septum site-determining protein MinC